MFVLERSVAMLNPLSGGSLQAALGNPAVSASDTPSKTSVAAAASGAGKDADPAAAPERGAVEKAVEKLNQSAQFSSQGLRFSIDDETGKTVVKVIDSATENVLRQIPTVDALALAHAIDKMKGMLLRDKA
jgi:flagellar protein FlaG